MPTKNRIILKIIRIDIGAQNEEREITRFAPAGHTTFKMILELESMLNKMSDDLTSFEVLAEREES